MSTESPYGSWKSPLSSKLACDSSISIKDIYVDPNTPDTLYWSELIPNENGRTIVFSKDVTKLSNTPERWTPDDFNVSNKVHEYGGGDFIVHGGTLYFMNFADGKIYKQSEKQTPNPVTKAEKHRYADADFFKHGNHIFCVREDHSNVEDHTEPVNTIVLVNVKTGEENIIASGYDFYSCPRVSPDNSKLVWMQWNHPNMPWDDTEIWIADIISHDDTVKVENMKRIAAESGVNYMEPRWALNGNLLFISDTTKWWNLYMISDFNTCKATNVHPRPEEIGGPMWQFAPKSYSSHPVNSEVVATIYRGKPAILNTASGSLEKIDVGNYSIQRCLFHPTSGNNLYLLASNPGKPQCILMYSRDTTQIQILHQPIQSILEEGYLSIPRHVEFPVDNSTTTHAYGYYYPPNNKDYRAPTGTLPPLLIKIHGGPTSSARLALDLNKQYFTSRGFAILDVNYRGSTGYGTDYRKALNGMWGVHDVEDACAGALYMSSAGDQGEQVHKEKLLIDGGSAGGYTTLACLTFRDVFKAGVSFYGVSDLEALAKDTHKFESRYLDNMVAPYPEGIAVYEARSPIKHVDQFETSCAFFQGGLDKVVPPNQAETMYNKIKDKGVPCAYVLFPDEAHGFKKSANKQKALDGEFYFYSQVLGFKPADEGIEIPIENLPTPETLSKKQKVI